ncbi:hypothetical protein J6590_008904 [Homalodisca vitripennis]|nr:hypothetical protein J6590_008904 [Homalodisca vitripennis]
MADSTEEISCMDIILRRSTLLVPGSMADSTEEIPCMDIILRRSALLVPGSMADSTEEIPCMDIILRRSALLVPGSMADSTEEIPCMDIILRRSALLVPGSMADSNEEIFLRLWRYATPESRDWLIAPQNWPECSQRQHNRINNRIQAHSATDLVECSQRQHNRINNRIHAHSATAHSATHLAGVLTAPQLIAPHICCGAVPNFIGYIIQIK